VTRPVADSKAGFVLAILSALVLGLAGGLMLDTGGSEVGPRILPAAEPARDPALSLPEPPSVPTPPRVSAAQTLPSPPIEASPDWIARLESNVPLPPRGRGRIIGRVLTEDGAPLTGVLVRAMGRPKSPLGRTRRPGGSLDEPDLEEKIRDVVAEHRWILATRTETRTDSNGVFVLEDLPDAMFSLVAGLDGYDIQAWGRAGGLLPGAEVEFRAAQVVDVPVALFSPNGESPPRARVSFEGSGRRTTALWTPQEPTVRVRPGTYRVDGSTDDPSPATASLEAVTLEIGRAPPPVTLRLLARRGIRGKVLFPDDEEPEAALVSLVPLSPTPQDEEERLWGSGDRKSVHRRQGYAFEFLDLDPGTYVLGVARRHRDPLVAEETVQVTDRLVERDLAVPRLDPREVLVLHVLDPEGRPLREVEIEAGTRGRGRVSSGSAATVLRSDGSYLVLHPPREPSGDSREGTDFVRVHSRRYGSEEVEYRRDRDSEVVVRLEEPATLEVTLLAYLGSGFWGLRGRLQPAAAFEQRWGRFQPGRPDVDPNMEGRLRFGPVQPGRYVVELRIPSKPGTWFTVATQEATLVSGENRISLGLPTLHRLVVVFEGAAPPQPLILQTVDPTGADVFIHGEVGDDGRATFERLPAGEYWVALGGQRVRSMRASLPGPEVVTFRVDAPDALAVTVEDPEGVLGRAGFRTGDVVVGVNGVSFRGSEDPGSSLGSALTSEREIVFRVLRGEALREIAVDLERFSMGSHGGRMEWIAR